MGRTSEGRTGAAWGAWVLGGVLGSVPVAAAVVLVGVPAAVVLWRLLRGGSPEDGALDHAELLRAVGRTLAAVMLIGGIATILAVPAGWLQRGRSRALGALMVVPLLLPSYLAYAGWGLLRGPRTVLGDALARSPAWVSEMAGRGFAVWGLALWSWPLAAMVIGVAARRIDQGVLDSLAMDVPSGWRRRLTTARLLGPGLLAGFGVVVLVMLGSAVPLDVSQFDTYSVALLRWLLVHPSDLPAWRASWPVLLIALAATVVLLRRGGGEGGEPAREVVRGRGRSSALLLGAALVWIMSVVAPGGLFILNLREPPAPATLHTIWRFLSGFWRDSWGAVVASLSVSWRVAAAALVIGGCGWYAASRGGWARRGAIIAAGVLLFAGLAPSVLVGTAVNRTVNGLVPRMAETTWIVVAAHLSRFAFLSLLVGCWLARRESRDERGLRRIDGADSVRGFAHACLARHWGTMVGISLAVGILSFHEIEATVIVWPPGERCLSQMMLDALHFARDERMAAGSVNLMAAGVVIAYVAGWMVRGSSEG